MQDSITFKRGDVVFVPFPYTDQSTNKKRPAVVVSADWYNTNKADLILVAITTSLPLRLDRDEYRLSSEDLKRANIPWESIIKIGKIFTIEKSKIIRQLGVLPTNTVNTVIEKLKIVFGLL